MTTPNQTLTRDTLIEVLSDHAKDLERKLDAAESMLARVGRECDIACIPTTDGDIPALRITYCEGHRVKLLRLKYEDRRKQPNGKS